MEPYITPEPWEDPKSAVTREHLVRRAHVYLRAFIKGLTCDAVSVAHGRARVERFLPDEIRRLEREAKEAGFAIRLSFRLSDDPNSSDVFFRSELKQP